MNNNIRQLWDRVFVPYLENYNSNYLLDKLTSKDYHKFYDFMVENNPTCNTIYENYKKCRDGEF